MLLSFDEIDLASVAGFDDFVAVQRGCGGEKRGCAVAKRELRWPDDDGDGIAILVHTIDVHFNAAGLIGSDGSDHGMRVDDRAG